MRLNIIFHDIVEKDCDINNPYCVTRDYFFNFKDRLESLVDNKKTRVKDLCFYFDDGYVSFKEYILPKIHDYSKYALAIVTDSINKKGYLSESDIIDIYNKDIKICSHGVSHAALAMYRNNELQNTPLGGEYQNCDMGKSKILSTNEVLYQFKESKKILGKIIGEVDEFVFPYGLYNENVIKVNEDQGIYKYLSTCDEMLDGGQSLRPRFLIDNSFSVEENISKIVRL